jgi:hypothetical protein
MAGIASEVSTGGADKSFFSARVFGWFLDLKSGHSRAMLRRALDHF